MLFRRPILDDRKRKARAPGIKLSQWAYLDAEHRAKTVPREGLLENDLTMIVISILLMGVLWFGNMWQAVLAFALSAFVGPFFTSVRGKDSAATLVMLGRCGSCGYQLDELVPESDGSVVCPECGCAWQQWRLTQRSREIWPPSYAEGRILEPSGPDDRGVLTLIHARSTIPKDSRMASRALDMATDRRWKQLLHIGMPIVFALLVVCFFGVTMLADGVVAVAVTFFLTLGIAVLAFIGQPSSTFRRDAFLSLGVCPCCLQAMNKSFAQDDGCVVCTCGSAWRAADISLPRAACHHCNYDLTDVPSCECPECGASKASRWQPREVGHPYCARCGGDMLGRENRVCEECGAMYGLEYRDQ